MRIGISGLAVGNRGGLGRLSRTAILALAAARPEWELHVYLRHPSHIELLKAECDRAHLPLLEGLNLHFAPLSWINRLLLEELYLPSRFSTLKLDAYFGLDFTLPGQKLAELEAVLLPDLLPFSHPSTVSWRARWLYRRGLRRSVARQAKLITISELTKTRLLEYFPEAKPCASVVIPALSPKLAQLAAASGQRDYALQVQGSAGSVSGPLNYLLYVGDFGPRKNVDLLVDVYTTMAEYADYAGSLVLVGGDGRHSTVQSRQTLALQPIGMAAERSPEGPQIYDIGRVPDVDLSQLYANADLLVSLSAQEGFGYPVLEALAHGTPAIVAADSPLAKLSTGGVASTKLGKADVLASLRSALNALPLLRQEVQALDCDWFTIERMGEDLACVLEAQA